VENICVFVYMLLITIYWITFHPVAFFVIFSYKQVDGKLFIYLADCTMFPHLSAPI